MGHDYATLPPEPARVDAAGILTRLVDAIGFRFHWATADLRADDWPFAAADGAMSLRACVEHIHALLRRTAADFGLDLDATPADDEARRAAVLEACGALRERVAACSDRDLAAIPDLWRLIQGPLADALTHIGQIATWRRIAGNPARRVSYLRGRVADEG